MSLSSCPVRPLSSRVAARGVCPAFPTASTHPLLSTTVAGRHPWAPYSTPSSSKHRHVVAKCAASYSAAADPVVTTEWLAQHLDEVIVLDVRGHVDTQLVAPGVEKSTYVAEYNEYLEGHIPGAVYWDWTTDAIDTSAAAPVQLQQDPDLLAAALEAKGISSDRPVVAYDSGDGMMAARLWWMLTVAGHPAAHVLDGGWNKWRAEQRKSELYEPCMLKVYGCFECELQPALRTTLEDLQDLQQARQQDSPTQEQVQQPAETLLLLDTRNVQQYTGSVRRGPRGGHIPGAVNLPRSALLDEVTGKLKPLDQQQEILRRAGVVLPSDAPTSSTNSQQQQQQRVILYCNGGVAACTAALALHRLGHRNWAVYDGSWNEYSSSQLPVAIPSLPVAP